MAQRHPQFTLADRVVSWFAPQAAVRRAHARQVLAYYEAAKPDRLRKGRRETGSGNDAVLRAGGSLRQLARHQEQNHDLALGVLNTLVNNTVGATGIGIEPQPRKKDGTIDDLLAREILKLHKDWARNPEVTRQHDWPSAQRMLARSWFRDGEVFSQQLIGRIIGLDHGTEVPYSIEMLEADFVPMDMAAQQPVIQQGVEINAWGRPVAYHVYKADPNETQGYLRYQGQTKRIAAESMLHLKNVHRIRQLRGVSVFASVLNRFDDLKDYEESERIAAKIAASMAAFIKKGSPDQYTEGGDARSLKMRPGMIFDDLRPGEEIGTIDTNRPNPNLETYRNGQLRGIAAGTGPTYSSIARNYNGTYSAQRQELVEGWSTYGVLAAEFTSRIVRPVYESFIAAAVLSGKLRIPAGTDQATLNDAIYLAPQMPWIDPKKEAEAYAILEDRAYISGPEIVRKRGGNPIDVIEQQARWLREKADNNIPPAGGTGSTEVANADQAPSLDAQARARWADAQASLAEANEKLVNAQTAREEEMAELEVEIAQANLQLVRANIDAAAASKAAAEAQAIAAQKTAERESADAEATMAQMALAAAEAEADRGRKDKESEQQLMALRSSWEAAEASKEQAERAAQAAEARAAELHAIALAAERKRERIAGIDLEAAQLALEELRGGE